MFKKVCIYVRILAFGNKIRSRNSLETLSSHFYKENNILFPTAPEGDRGYEWIEVRKKFDEFGYVKFIQGVPNLPETLLKRGG